jgi:hypothetical protein
MFQDETEVEDGVEVVEEGSKKLLSLEFLKNIFQIKENLFFL